MKQNIVGPLDRPQNIIKTKRFQGLRASGTGSELFSKENSKDGKKDKFAVSQIGQCGMGRDIFHCYKLFYEVWQVGRLLGSFF